MSTPFFKERKMPNGIVNRADFDKIEDHNVKLGIVFETIIDTQGILKQNIEETNRRFEAGNKRFRKMEKKALVSHVVDKGISVTSGFVGGFLAILTKPWWGK